MSDSENTLYSQLLTYKILKIGWDLYRRDQKQNFIENTYSTAIAGAELKSTIGEIQKRLLNGDYKPRNLLRTEIPKKGLGVRPGATMLAEDAIVMQSIMFLLAFQLNSQLSPNVYSFRLKDDVVEKRKYTNGKDLFKESMATEVPFLKKSTIYKKYMQYDDWYITWIEFDRRSKENVKNNRYQYMATSDIAAYFENIQLPILKNQIQKAIPNEPKLINLLFDFLMNWTERTEDGEILSRGLPQGSSVFSFLGNYYLKPIDDYFENHSKKDEFEYFRYMDDIKIFTNDINLAKKLLLELNRELRKLHLNTQSAKTEIFNEANNHEISKELMDSRIEELQEIKVENINKLSKQEKKNLLQRVETIISKKSSNGVTIKGHKKPLKGLDMRLFIMYITISCGIKSDKFINPYFKELDLNFDQKLLKKLPTITKIFSKHTTLEKKIVGFMESKKIIVPYQKAICIKALRYLDRLSNGTEELIYSYLCDPDENFYVRFEAAMFLSTTQLSASKIKIIEDLWTNEKNIFLQGALSFVLTQRVDKLELMKRLIFYPNHELNKIHILFYKLRTDIQFARDHIDFYMKNIVDYIPLINIIASSNSLDILLFLREKLKDTNLCHITNSRVRKYLKHIRQEVILKIKKQSNKVSS